MNWNQSTDYQTDDGRTFGDLDSAMDHARAAHDDSGVVIAIEKRESLVVSEASFGDLPDYVAGFLAARCAFGLLVKALYDAGEPQGSPALTAIGHADGASLGEASDAQLAIGEPIAATVYSVGRIARALGDRLTRPDRQALRRNIERGLVWFRLALKGGADLSKAESALDLACRAAGYSDESISLESWAESYLASDA